MQVQFSQEERCLTLLAALLLPLRSVSMPLGKGSKASPLASWIIRESIKWTNRDADGVAALHAGIQTLLEVDRQLQVL